MVTKTHSVQQLSLKPTNGPRHRCWWHPAFIVGAALMFGAYSSFAQNSADEDRLALEEVVVTASKLGYAESLQDVPMSIQALTEDTLEQAGAKDFQDFAKLAPSVDLLNIGTGTPQVAIRGVRVGRIPDKTTQEKPLVSIYIDDLPVSLSNFNLNLDLFDVQRIEVLRGPQGTLYGLGAMGGNIRFVTNQPDAQSLSGKVEASLGAIESGGDIYDLKGLVNVPLVEDKLALRVTATTHKNEGYIDNDFLGIDDWNELERTGIRASLLYDASEKLSLTFNYLFQQATMNRGRNLVTSDDYSNPVGTFYHKVPFDEEMSIYNLTLGYDLGWANLHSSSSYYERDFLEGGTVQGLIETFFGLQSKDQNKNDWETSSFVQELRLTSSSEGRFGWVAGVFYSDEKQAFLQDYTYPAFGALTGIPTGIWGAPPDVLFFGDVDNSQEQWAIFGELHYQFAEQWELTLGLRWFDWEQEFDLLYAGFFNAGLDEILGEGTSASEFTPKATLSYSPTEDWMLYVNAAKGYRLGGANDPVPVRLCAADLGEVGLTQAPTTFEPDSLWSYELGSKATLANGRVTLNAAAFRIEWKDVQTLKTLPNCAYYFTENVGEVETNGVEIEFTAVLMEGMTLTFGGTYTDAALSRDVPNLFGQSGDPVPFVPELSLSASVEYFRPVANRLEGYIRLDVQHVGHRNTEFNHSRGLPLDSYELGNLHLGLIHEKWEASAWVKNLWDEEAVLNATQQLGYNTWVIEQPRTLGLTLRYRF